MALPGTSAVIADGKLRIQPSISGPKVTLLGTTDKTGLPLLEPISITDSRMGIAALEHDAGTPSELSIALEEVMTAGAQNVEVIIISASSGEAAAFTSNDRWDGLVEAYKVLRAHETDIIHPVGAFLDDGTLTGTDGDGNTRTNFARQLGDICHQTTTGDANTTVGVIGVTPLLKMARAESWTDVTDTDVAEFFATPSRAFVKEWVSHLTGASGELQDHSAEEMTSIGYLAGSDQESAGVVSASYDMWARDTDASTAVDNFSVKVDGGGYLSVVAGCVRQTGPAAKKLIAKYSYAGTATSYNSNGAASYAGLISTLDPHIGTTNKAVTGVIPAREFTRAQAESILDERMVTWKKRPNTGYVVLKGVTGAYNASTATRSDFVMLTTRRITHAALDAVAEAAEPYIGYPNNDINLNAMEAAIDENLRALSPDMLRRFDFRVETTPDQRVLGQAYIYLTIVPAFEITNITVYIALAKE